MKNIILLTVLSICLTACNSTNEKKHSENIDLVKSYVKSVEELDFDSMANFLHDDYLGVGPSYGDSIRKTEAIKNWKESVENLYESIKYTRSRFVAVTIPDGENKGEWVANWAELHIVYKNGVGSATIWANTNYFVKEGKILESITFYNEADVLQQLGYSIVPTGDAQ